MGRFVNWFRGGWRWLGHVSVMQWVWTFIPASAVGAAITGLAKMTANQPLWWLLVLFFASTSFIALPLLGLAIWRGEQKRRTTLMELKHLKEGPPAPLVVLPRIHSEILDVIDDAGAVMPSVVGVIISLRVVLSESVAGTLRNVQARMHLITGESTILPIRNILDPHSLRHGEAALVEIGHVVIAKEHSNGIPSARAQIRGDLGSEHNAALNHRTLHVSDISGDRRVCGIGQEAGTPFPDICVVISADDVPGTQILLDMDLYKEKRWDWFSIKSDALYDRR